MSEDRDVMIEIECPACRKILISYLGKAEDYPKKCVCGEKLEQPDRDELTQFIESCREEQRLIQERYNSCGKKYGHLKTEEYTDEIIEEREREFEELRKEVSALKRPNRPRRVRGRSEAGVVESVRPGRDRTREECEGIFGTILGESE